MTLGDFIEAVGHAPEQDDLERSNCPQAGEVGHYGCGVCKHGKPVFLCHDCFVARCKGYQW